MAALAEGGSKSISSSSDDFAEEIFNNYRPSDQNFCSDFSIIKYFVDLYHRGFLTYTVMLISKDQRSNHKSEFICYSVSTSNTNDFQFYILSTFNTNDVQFYILKCFGQHMRRLLTFLTTLAEINEKE